MSPHCSQKARVLQRRSPTHQSPICVFAHLGDFFNETLQRTFFRVMLLTIHYSLFTIHYSLFTIRSHDAPEELF
jgi:hypothetical protein